MAARKWTEEQRARQAEAIRRWAPWLKSTGPRTRIGKLISSKNAMDMGFYCRAHLVFNALMRRHASFCARVRALAASDFPRNELLALWQAPVVLYPSPGEVLNLKGPQHGFLSW